ncbi:Transposon TX1 uncharacterized 149 kDa protein [Vitis vinifera]|uniref:Transposon TX1 uncharacterized 149 kDa protein n=1 Tax=Vitis vinifera TaxID=29760 RepID=A0A438KN43_VITVI|nr:Transposon TX1 uncharacterized 149 kDa protein [Vitis vinifera]
MFKEPQVRRSYMATELFKSIDSMDREILEGPFPEKEPTMGREVMQSFEEFHVQNSMTCSLNATFLVFIPKKRGAGDMKDFRPISLLGSLYKLLAKVLANRLKRVMGKVVSNSQNAFVGSKQILDAILIANEAVDSRKRSSNAGLVCKLDIEKAYDQVSWKFLLSVLEKWVLAPSGAMDSFLHSHFIPVGETVDVNRAASLLGCKVGKLLASNLLGAPNKHYGVWDSIEERKIICGKFKEVEGGWTTRVWRKSFRMNLWKDIRKGWEEFNVKTFICIGYGSRTSFWWDIWAGDFKLKDVYPTIFRIASHKNATIADSWKRERDERGVERFILEDPSKIGR